MPKWTVRQEQGHLQWRPSDATDVKAVAPSSGAAYFDDPGECMQGVISVDWCRINSSNEMPSAVAHSSRIGVPIETLEGNIQWFGTLGLPLALP